MAAGAGLLVEVRLPSRPQVMAIAASQSHVIEVEGVVEGPERAGDRSLADTVMAGGAVGLRVAMVARRASGGAESDDLSGWSLLVRSVTRSAIERRPGDVNLVREGASLESPLAGFHSLMAPHAG
jgi:hypothetical protein